ncbi:MAG: protein kinase [Euryarchaeota archaeon]|nr:protein kinase [Euryarchaeota archaeon]
MRELNIPKIEDPRRFFPDPVLVKSPTIRILEDGYGEFHHPERDKWERVHPICLEIIAALEKGLPFNELVKSLSPYPAQNINRQNAVKLARKYCWKLHNLGYVRIDVEGPPAAFADRYVRIQELGRGGLGIAHLCHDREDDDHPVVVKHPWGIKSGIDSGQKAIAHEIHLIKTLDHPAVPVYHDHFEVRGLLHLVREFFDGDRLTTAASKRRHDRPWRLDVARQIADVLGHIHDAGYLFYDPSPDNFFLRPDGSLVVSDLGSARAFDGDRVKVRGPRGSPGYIAPEMRSNENVHDRWASRRSDVYSLGAVYLYLTTGQRIGRTGGFREALALMDQRGVEGHDRDIITTLMADDPMDRPADMTEARALFT